MKSLTPIEAGMIVARKLFEKRGNHSEAHLTELELAALIALGFEMGQKSCNA